MGLLQLGPLSIKYEWIILILAALVTFFVLKTLLKNQTFKQQFIDSLFNAVIVVILTYKLSIILFRPSILIENPLGILYFNGGTKGLILGGILSLLYLRWSSKKKAWSNIELFQGLTISIISFFLAYWLIRTLFILFVVA